jgi:hypothetical protein
MNFKLKSLATVSLLLLTVPSALLAADANDNYTTATTDKWINDSSNEAVNLINIMTCMAGEGGVSRAGFANKSWIGIVDEKTCGMDDGDDSAQAKKSKIQFTSTLAAAGETQEVVGYMEQSNGQKIIMTMQIKASATTLPPYGDWFSSFYFVNDTDKNYANQTGTVFHGYGEVKQVGSDVVVMSAHSPQDASGESPSIETKIVYAGGSVADVTYNYKMAGLTGNNAAGNGYYVGKASATELYTGYVDTSNNFQVGQSQCKKRDSIWQSSWLGALYDTTTNERLKLATPPFQFTVDSDGSRGNAQKDNSWMENDALRMKLDPAANTVAVTRSDTAAAVTLQWTPSRMENKSFSAFSPAPGDIFNSNNGRAKWDGTDLKADQDNSSANGYEYSIDTKTNVWNAFSGAEFTYDGTATPGTWKMINMAAFAAADYPSSGTSAKYRCYGTSNCPHTNGSDGNMNPTLSEFKAIEADNTTDWWNEFHGSRGNAHNGATEFHYYLTSVTPPAGYAGATLYWDAGKDGLDTGDKPVMFKFNVANTNVAGSWLKKVVEHGTDTVANFTTDGSVLADNDSNALNTRGMSATLVPDASSSCDASNWDLCTTAVQFNAEQWVYSQPLIPKNASGTVIDISPVMKMKYTQAIANDLNYNGGTPIVIPATFSTGNWIEWLSKSCAPGMTEDLATDNNNNTCQIEIDLTAFNGKVINVRYDGAMSNLPGYYDQGQKTFYRIINPIDGAIFTSMADSTKTYKYKALGIDEVFVPQASASSCAAGVKFTSIPTGFAAADLPSYATKARPSQIWDTKPTAPSCILEGDVETNCD